MQSDGPSNKRGSRQESSHREFVGASYISFASVLARKLIHFAAPPLPTESADSVGTPCGEKKRLLVASATGRAAGSGLFFRLVSSAASSRSFSSTAGSGLLCSAAGGGGSLFLVLTPSKQIGKCHGCFLLSFRQRAIALCVFYYTDGKSSYKYALFYNYGYLFVSDCIVSHAAV